MALHCKGGEGLSHVWGPRCAPTDEQSDEAFFPPCPLSSSPFPCRLARCCLDRAVLAVTGLPCSRRRDPADQPVEGRCAARTASARPPCWLCSWPASSTAAGARAPRAVLLAPLLLEAPAGAEEGEAGGVRGTDGGRRSLRQPASGGAKRGGAETVKRRPPKGRNIRHHPNHPYHPEARGYRCHSPDRPSPDASSSPS
jgi:hypothetical protein